MLQHAPLVHSFVKEKLYSLIQCLLTFFKGSIVKLILHTVIREIEEAGKRKDSNESEMSFIISLEGPDA